MGVGFRDRLLKHGCLVELLIDVSTHRRRQCWIAVTHVLNPCDDPKPASRKSQVSHDVSPLMTM